MQNGVFQKIWNNTEYSNTIKTVISSGTGNVKELLINSVVPYFNKLKESIPAYDNVIMTFSQCNELLHDDEEAADSFHVIPDDVHQNIVDLFTTQFINGYTITLRSGEAVAFRISEGFLHCVQGVNNIALTAFVNGEYLIRNTVLSITGSVLTIDDIIKDLLESNEINNMLHDVISNIISSGASFNVNALVSKYSNSKFCSVRDMIDQVSKSFTSANIYGVIGYIKDLLTAFSTIRADDNTISFTDNYAYIPTNALAGIAEQVWTTVGTVATVIASMFSRIAAIAIAGVTAIGKLIFSIVNASVNDERGSINSDPDKDILPCAPYATFQRTGVPLLEIQGTAIANAIDNGESFGFIYVPGGIVVFGPTSFNQDGSVATVGWEFHPSILDNYDDALNIFEYMRTHGLIMVDPDSLIPFSVSVTTVPLGYVTIDFSSPYTDNQREYINTKLIHTMRERDIVAFKNQVEGDQAGTLDDYSAEVLIKNCYSNSFLFFTAMLVHGHTLSLRFPVEKISDGGNSYYYSIGDWTHVRNALNDHWCNALLLQGFIYGDHYCLLGSIDYQGSTFDLYLKPLGMSRVDNWSGIAKLAAEFTDMSDVYYNFGSSKWADQTEGNLYYIISSTDYFPVPNKYLYAVNTPKYSAGSIINAIIAGGIIAAVTTAAVVTVSIVAKRKLQSIRARNNALVGQAWQNLQDHPNDANYTAYRKAVKKNNRLVSIIGGTRYDVDDYWFGSGQSSQDTVNSAQSIINGASINDVILLIRGEDSE